MNLVERVLEISHLFDVMDRENASQWQKDKVAEFRRDYPELNDDLDFCFEVLAGKHKLGFTVRESDFYTQVANINTGSIKNLFNYMKTITIYDKSEQAIDIACMAIPIDIRRFMIKLLNREYRLGYSNKGNMVTDKHCMLAKPYPAGIKEAKRYYIQEKLNGNRCIAYYENDMWHFMSRSQKPLKLNFDMTGFDTTRVYDGEVMTRDKMGNRDFSRTSGTINSKFGDKSNLMYFVYDVLDDQMSYKERRAHLLNVKGTTHPSVVILKVLDKIMVYPDPALNQELDKILDYIVAHGGEGVILRDPDAPYHHSKNSGDRKPYLLKYKKTKTCELRIISWNEGKSKYEGMIGSFICATDDQQVIVSVAGISDDIRMSDPKLWIGKIIEVTYFEYSKSDVKDVYSLQFPRMTGVRNDKDETSTTDEILNTYIGW